MVFRVDIHADESHTADGWEFHGVHIVQDGDAFNELVLDREFKAAEGSEEEFTALWTTKNIPEVWFAGQMYRLFGSGERAPYELLSMEVI